MNKGVEENRVSATKRPALPSGILLWGPPGTGKTLMAEAVAGETGKPYVFVDPGAFIQMFMGIGVLKVKGLFRKLRKLSLKYGGVIVFFDEADTLGNRGAAVGGGGFGSNAELHRMFASDTHCNGLHYLAPGTASMLTNERMAAIALAASATERRKGWREQLPIMMGGMGGGGGMGTLQALLTEQIGRAHV